MTGLIPLLIVGVISAIVGGIVGGMSTYYVYQQRFEDVDMLLARLEEMTNETEETLDAVKQKEENLSEEIKIARGLNEELNELIGGLHDE